MKINKTRIRTLGPYLFGINDNDNFYIALAVTENPIEKLVRAGFSNQLSIGEQVLPSVIGSVTNYNANGGVLIDRDMPMETVYRYLDVKDWHGNYHSVSIPYKRYPRTQIPAPNTELTIVIGPNEQKLIRSPVLVKGITSEATIIHNINLFLELFGECGVVQSDLLPVFRVPITKLNWSLLPPGNYPWQVLKENIRQSVRIIRGVKKRMVEKRLEVIASHNPCFVAIGEAGFKGYIVFGFENKNFYILESLNLGNATYILGEDWERLSQLSKGKILNQELHIDRFIHSEVWNDQIHRLFQ